MADRDDVHAVVLRCMEEYNQGRRKETKIAPGFADMLTDRLMEEIQLNACSDVTNLLSGTRTTATPVLLPPGEWIDEEGLQGDPGSDLGKLL